MGEPFFTPVLCINMAWYSVDSGGKMIYPMADESLTEDHPMRYRYLLADNDMTLMDFKTS